MEETKSRKKFRRRLIIGTAAGVAGVLAVVVSATAAPDKDKQEKQGTATVNSEAVAAALKNAATVGAAPGGLALITDEKGKQHRFATGEADIATGRKPAPNDRFRIGSLSKVFVSTVVLQLEADKKLSLNDKVEKWLPGKVPAGSPITVHQLLQHTSGLPDFVRHLPLMDNDKRGTTYTPDQLLALIKDDKPYFEPGASWGYSNTNYLLAGMLIKKVTGNDWRREMQGRIIKPLGLSATSTPGTSTAVPGPHLHGYETKAPESKELVDVTVLSPTMADAAGELISNTADINRFLGALFGGKLLPAKQLAQMTKVMEVPDLKGGYGLGLMRTDLSCGISVYGHGGQIPGYNTWGASTADGKRVMAGNVNKIIAPQSASTEAFAKLMEASFCPTK